MASIMYEPPALVVLGSVVALTETENFFVSVLDVPPDTSHLVP